MGEFLDKAKAKVEEVGGRISDKADEVKADSDVKSAEAKRDAVHERNDAKDAVRDNT